MPWLSIKNAALVVLIKVVPLEEVEICSRLDIKELPVEESAISIVLVWVPVEVKTVKVLPRKSSPIPMGPLLLGLVTLPKMYKLPEESLSISKGLTVALVSSLQVLFSIRERTPSYL